jgi:tetratricopeptide (TPR) repeat protein
VSQREAHKLPLVWNVPFGRSPSFTGRVDELDKLRQVFRGAGPGSIFQALHGLGGIGKTQLAVEYAYRFSSDYDAVWWVRAEEPATLAADFADLAAALRLPGRNEGDQRLSIDAVRQWLAGNGRWLMIFDSAREPKEVAPYLTSAGSGHVLVTSRHASWRGVAMPLPLRGLKRRDAASLLLSRSGTDDRSQDSADAEEALEAQEAPALALAEALGDLPLALAQAGAYIEETGTTIAAYLELFRARQEALLRRGAAGASAPTVATTWDIAFRDVQAHAPAAAELLALCAFLAPDDIPREGLREGADRCPPALVAALKDPLALDDAVAALRRYSLVDAQEEGLGVHRLVQAVVRERLPDDERRAWAERAVWLVNQVFPSDIDDPGVWSTCKRWLPHALAVSEHAAAARVAEETVEQLCHRAAKYNRMSGALVEARQLYQRAIALALPLYGREHAEIASLYRGLALTLVIGEFGDPDDAAGFARRALEIDLALFGPDDETVARDHNCLVRVFRRLGDLKAASAHLELAIDIFEQVYGPVYPNLISMLNDQGFLLRELKDLKGARPLLERALELGEKTHGVDHPDVATYHSNLATVLEELGDLASARKHAVRALEIGEKRYGPDHYVVAIRRNNLGFILRSLGDLEGARDQFARALEIGRVALPPGHRRTQRFESNLRAVLAEIAKRDRRT